MSEATELIKERLDIAEVVGEYMTLKRSGQYFKGLCPFHQEKTPSFVVSPDKGIWHCFGGCSEGGDVFSFVQKIEGIDFPAALKMLAARAGVTLKSNRQAASGRGQSRRERLFELLELTGRFYHEILINQAAGERAKGYLQKRGVNGASWQAFQLGYAPKKWDALYNWLREKKFAPAEMVAAGVVGASERGSVYDRFRGRIIFPIRDRGGRVVALGGRIAPWHATGEEGKYINSPETELYRKREVIFNLDRAKSSLRGGQACLVVEGYLDVVLLDQVGVKNVVASSGTAFTEEHIRELRRFTKTLHFAFDADKAGVKAGIAATRSALAAGMRVATVMLPDGQDPADLALADPEKLMALVATPRSLIAVLLERLAKTGKASGREEYLEALLPLVAGVTNVVQQGEMVQEIARLLAVPEAKVLKLLAEQAYPAAKRAQVAVERADAVQVSERGSIAAERYLLGLILNQPLAGQKIMADLTEDMFDDVPAKKLLVELKGLNLEQKGLDLVGALPAAMATFAEGLKIMAAERLEMAPGKAGQELAVLVKVLRESLIRKRLKDLQEYLIRGNDKQRRQALYDIKAAVGEIARLNAEQASLRN